MGLRTFLREVWRYLVFIIVVVVASSAIAFAISSVQQKTYTAQSKLVVTAGLGTAATGGGDVLTAPRIGQTYAVLATTRPILLEVIARANLPYDTTQLLTHLTVTSDIDTPFMTVTMVDPDRSRAAETANVLADVLVEKATIAATTAAPAQVLLANVERAAVPDNPTGPRVLFNTLMAAGAALLLALVIVAFVAYLGNDPAKRAAAG